ncbi:MAG: protease inhibitor I9 family protein, partial [Lutisporaceae bacterium]
MKHNLGRILVFMLIVSMLATSAIYFAAPQDKTATVAADKIEIQADLDKNKLFDNLEEKLNNSSENDILPVIIVFNEEIDSNKKGLVKKIMGDTTPKHEYKIIPGMAVELTKGQINAISKLDFVKQVEYDMPVYA